MLFTHTQRILEMAERNIVGLFNFTNPGTMSHDEILHLYKKHIDNTFKWENFTVEQQNNVLKSERPNCELCVSKLLNIFPDIPHVRDGMEALFLRIKEKREKSL